MATVFNNMAGGRWWGTLFFLFMVFAALSTVLGVCDNILAMVREPVSYTHLLSHRLVQAGLRHMAHAGAAVNRDLAGGIRQQGDVGYDRQAGGNVHIAVSYTHLKVPRPAQC